MSALAHDSDTDSPQENNSFLEGAFKRIVTKSTPTALLGEHNNEMKTLLKNPMEVPSTSTAMRRAGYMNDDSDDDLGFDPKQPKLANKTNLFDNFLKDNVQTTRPATAGKPVISRQSTATISDNSNIFNLTRPKTTAGRRSSNNSAMIPANTYLNQGSKHITAQEHSKTTDSVATTSKMSYSVQRNNLDGNWLGINMENVESTDHNFVDKSSSSMLNKNENEAPINVSTPESTTKSIMQLKSLDNANQKTLLISQNQENAIEMVMESVKQDKALTSLVQKQNSLLEQQQCQYESFAEQQQNRQQKMQEFVEEQQKRINKHMHLLKELNFKDIPMLLFPSTSEENNQKVNNDDNTEQFKMMINSLQKEIDVKRLEMENERLEALIVNINANYEREIEALISSYKKQLDVLEEQRLTLENYYRQDIESRVQFYEAKIEQIKNEMQQRNEFNEKHLINVRDEYEKDKRMMRDLYYDNFEILKNENQKMLNAIQEIHKQELAFRQDKNHYGTILQDTLNSVNHLDQNFNVLREELQNATAKSTVDTDPQYLLRVQQLTESQQRLIEAYEKAKVDNIRLETLIDKHSNEYRREKAERDQLKLKQAAEFETEKSELAKDYARLEVEKKNFADFKNQQLEAIQQKTAELKEERENMMLEKSRLECAMRDCNIANKHNKEENLRIRKILDETQLKWEKMEEEKRNLKISKNLHDKNRYELEKRQNSLDKKNEDLEVMRHDLQRRDAKNKLQLRDLNADRQILQRRGQHLNKVEESVTRKQANLSQERLALQQMKIEIEKGRCAVCRLQLQHAGIDTQISNSILATNSLALNDNSSSQSFGNFYRTVYLDTSNNVNNDFHNSRLTSAELGFVDKILENDVAQALASTSLGYHSSKLL